jgi:hypothetical protein
MPGNSSPKRNCRWEFPGYHWFAGDPGKDEKPNPTAEYIGQQDID